MNFEQKKYVFIKPYGTKEGIIPEGSEIIVFRDIIYLNGGMIHPAYQQVLMNIISNNNLNNEYLKEVSIIQNKI